MTFFSCFICCLDYENKREDFRRGQHIYKYIKMGYSYLDGNITL